jgi:hypothetical protein
VTVSIKDIVIGLEMQGQEGLAFLDLDSGKVETVSRSLLSEAEGVEEEVEEGTGGEEPDGPGDEWDLALRIAGSDRYLRLPTTFDIHELSIMTEFAQSDEAGKAGAELEDALRGGGAFRHFKGALRRRGIEKKWFAFRDEALREIAIEWCEEHGISWQ